MPFRTPLEVDLQHLEIDSHSALSCSQLAIIEMSNVTMISIRLLYQAVWASKKGTQIEAECSQTSLKQGR